MNVRACKKRIAVEMSETEMKTFLTALAEVKLPVQITARSSR